MADSYGGRVLAETLREQGVDTVFTLCGNHTLQAYQACKDVGIELVDTRTEAGAVLAADAQARVTRRPAVALVTGGPGHTNALTGLVTAHSCGSPVVLISGATDQRLRGRGAQQEMDQASVAAPLCKWSCTVTDVEHLATSLREAFSRTLSGHTGAVHVCIPSDVLAARVDDAATPTTPGQAAAAEAPVADETLAGEVTARLAAAERPVVIAGTGAYMARCEEALARFVSAGNLPLFTIDLARGMVSDDAPGVFGYADASLNGAAAAIGAADVVLLLGKTLDFRLRFGASLAEDAFLIDVHALHATPDDNRRRDLSIGTDLASFVDVLAGQVASRAWDDTWLRKVAQLPRVPGVDADATVGGGAAAPPFHPLAVARAIRAALPDEAALVLDAGDFVQWCRSELPAAGPGRWLRLGPMSTCGAGTPLALGLRRARPDAPVVLITGDGSFGYYLAEFEAALRQRLPFVAIVGHNSSWGLEYNLQAGLYGQEYVLASELGPTRYDHVITALGGYGERVTSLDELSHALTRAIVADVPACLEVPVQRTPSPLTEAVIARGGEV